jgi:hypothetical protein
VRIRFDVALVGVIPEVLGGHAIVQKIGQKRPRWTSSAFSNRRPCSAPLGRVVLRTNALVLGSYLHWKSAVGPVRVAVDYDLEGGPVVGVSPVGEENRAVGRMIADT